MARDPISKRELNSHFEWPVTDGPSWERLCDGLKYQDIRDHVEIEFTWIKSNGEPTRISGRVSGIVGSAGNPDANPSVSFVPSYDCSTHPIPLEISYWPNHRAGYVVDVKVRDRFVSTI